MSAQKREDKRRKANPGSRLTLVIAEPTYKIDRQELKDPESFAHRLAKACQAFESKGYNISYVPLDGTADASAIKDMGRSTNAHRIIVIPHADRLLRQQREGGFMDIPNFLEFIRDKNLQVIVLTDTPEAARYFEERPYITHFPPPEDEDSPDQQNQTIRCIGRMIRDKNLKGQGPTSTDSFMEGPG